MRTWTPSPTRAPEWPHVSVTHQTSLIVKLGEPEHFTNSYPYEAILGTTGTYVLGCTFKIKFQTLAKKIWVKMTPEVEFLMYPLSFAKFYFTAQFELQPSKAAKKAPQTTRACFHSRSSALATVLQLWAPICHFLKIIFPARLVFFGCSEQPRSPPKAPGFVSLAAEVLW